MATSKSTSLTSFLGGATLPSLTGSALSAALSAGVADTGSSGGRLYIGFSGKSGKYAFGRAKEPVDPEAVFLVEPTSFLKGWTCWKGGKAIDKKAWPLIDDETKGIKEADLPDHEPYNEKKGEGWKPMLGFGMVTCDKLHQSVSFELTSLSGVNVIRDLVIEVANRSAVEEPALPLISFSEEEFVAQESTNWKPKLIRHSWTDRVTFSSYLDGDIDLDELLAGGAVEEPVKKAEKKPTVKRR